jgi:hypothetical protein
MRRDRVASALSAAAAAGRARHGTSYFDGVPVGLEVEPLPVVLSLGDVVDGGMVVAGGVIGGGVVDGDADGVRSPGFSPRRSFFDSEQAVTRTALSASAHRPVSTFFIWMSPCCGVAVHANPGIGAATRVPSRNKFATRVPAALTGQGTSHYQCG